MIVCPYCRAEHKDDPRNTPGAVDLCVVCGAFYVHSSSGPRRPGMAETKAIACHPNLTALRLAWEKTQRQIGNQTESGSFDFGRD